MIILEYDAYNGEAYRDGDCDSVVQELVNSFPHESRYIFFATTNLLTAVRVAVKQKLIPNTAIEVRWLNPETGQLLIQEIDSDGRMDSWPAGFCDYEFDKMLILL